MRSYQNLIVPGIVILLTAAALSCRNRSNPSVQNIRTDVTSMNSENNKATDNPYLDLRSQALSTTPEQLQVKIPSAQTKVIGMIVDWNLGGGSATFVSFSTGDASMYTSSGGGIHRRQGP